MIEQDDSERGKLEAAKAAKSAEIEEKRKNLVCIFLNLVIVHNCHSFGFCANHTPHHPLVTFCPR